MNELQTLMRDAVEELSQPNGSAIGPSGRQLHNVLMSRNDIFQVLSAIQVALRSSPTTDVEAYLITLARRWQADYFPKQTQPACHKLIEFGWNVTTDIMVDNENPEENLFTADELIWKEMLNMLERLASGLNITQMQQRKDQNRFHLGFSLLDKNFREDDKVVFVIHDKEALHDQPDGSKSDCVFLAQYVKDEGIQIKQEYVIMRQIIIQLMMYGVMKSSQDIIYYRDHGTLTPEHTHSRKIWNKGQSATYQDHNDFIDSTHQMD